MNLVTMFKLGQSNGAVKQNTQKVSFAGSELPHSTKLAKADSFQKQHKLNSVCLLTDLYGTPAMI